MSLELGRQARISVLARGLSLLLFACWWQRDLDGSPARLAVRGRVAIGTVRAGCRSRDLGYLAGDGVEAGLDQLLDGILVVNKLRQYPKLPVEPAPRTNFLIAEVLSNFFFQTLADLFARHRLKVGRGEDVVNDAGVGSPLFVGHCVPGFSRRGAEQWQSRPSTSVHLQGADMLSGEDGASIAPDSEQPLEPRDESDEACRQDSDGPVRRPG